MKIRDKGKNIVVWLKGNKAIFVAILLLMLCFGLMDTVIAVIDKTLLLVTNIPQNSWIDWLFIFLTAFFAIVVLLAWINNKKIVTPRNVGIILVPVVLYSYFRFSPDSPYIFTSYWNGPFSYLDGLAIVGLFIIVQFICQRCHKAGQELKDDQYSFDLDAPIKRSDKDLFNMGNLVTRIVNYIAFTDVREGAFSMGIVGEWGDGKTSLMNLVEEKIKAEHGDFLIVHFNPRGSKKADFIQEDFLDSLKQALSPKHYGVDRKIDKYAEALDVISGVPPIVAKGLDMLQIRSDKQREIKYGDLLKAIRDIGHRIVVMVDDLDRLTGEELIEVLKVLDTNGAFPNMVFLTSFDKDYVNTVLNNYLHLGNQTRAYTDKYFTVEIRVPLHPAFRLLDYLVSLLKDAVKGGFITQIIEAQVEEQTRKLSSYIMPRLRTIRDIKRFANQFLYDYAEVQKDVRYDDFLLLELIKFAHHEDYESIYRMKYIHRGQTSFFATTNDELLYLNDKLLPKKNKAGDDYEEPEIIPESIDILKILFPEEGSQENWYQGRYQRVYSVSSFEHYFYNYEYNHLKSEDFDRLFKEKSINEVFSLIDGWEDFTKDLETYLLTRDVNSIKDKGVLRRYLQVLLYAAHKHQNIYYLGHNYSFLRKEDVEKMCKNCGFASLEEYVSWFKDSMAELTAIEPMIPANYMRTPISGMFSENAKPDFFVMTLSEMQEYALQLLNDYIKLAGTEGWDESKVYYMAHIQNDGNGACLPAANKALHDVIINHFHLFSANLPFFAEDFDATVVGFNIGARIRTVFENKEEFENLINKKDNDDAAEIELIRAIWPLFKANDYNNVALPKGISIEEAKKTKLKAVLAEISRYEEVDRNLDALAKDWNEKRSIDNVDAFINRAKDILKDLNSIPLELKKRETFQLQIRDMLNEFQRFAHSAQNEKK